MGMFVDPQSSITGYRLPVILNEFPMANFQVPPSSATTDCGKLMEFSVRSQFRYFRKIGTHTARKQTGMKASRQTEDKQADGQKDRLAARQTGRHRQA
jgi:hypothetical protein